MESLDIDADASIVYTAPVPTDMFNGCTALKSAVLAPFPKLGNMIFGFCPNLQTAQLGGIGAGMTDIGSLAFRYDTQANLTITIYVDDETAIPLTNSPFGATNATIIYRRSTTGEVRTV